MYKIAIIIITKVKKIFILLSVVLPLIAFGQSSESQVEELKSQISFESRKNEILNNKMNALESKLEVLKNASNENSKSINESAIAINEKAENVLNMQAQNERAVNIALDEFSKKFIDQNKSVEFLKAKMQEDLYSKIIFYAVAILVFAVILYISVLFATKRALDNHKQGWKEFNEKVFKQQQ